MSSGARCAVVNVAVHSLDGALPGAVRVDRSIPMEDAAALHPCLSDRHMGWKCDGLDQVDTDQHGGLLAKFGIDPGDLLGGGGDGLAGKVGL